MKLKYSFENVKIGDKYICVPVENGAEDIHGVVRLNKEGMEIFSLLREETTVDSIVDQLSAKYDSDRETMKGYVLKLVEKLKDVDLIEE